MTIDLDEFYVPGERVLFDLRPHLFQELILREKDFRDFVKNNDWSVYKDKLVGVVCTADAFVPTWAYMLISIALEPHARTVVFGDLQALEEYVFVEQIAGLDAEKFRDARVTVKGCSDLKIPVNAYVLLSRKLRPVAKSIMYGEPCSTVPLYKSRPTQSR